MREPSKPPLDPLHHPGLPQVAGQHHQAPCHHVHHAGDTRDGDIDAGKHSWPSNEYFNILPPVYFTPQEI